MNNLALSVTWTLQDFLADKCAYDAIGHPCDGLSTRASDLPTIQEIGNDALRAYRELGGVVWLKRKPRLYSKLMVQALSEKPAAQVIRIRVG